MSSPQLSVLMAVYNGGNALTASLQSIAEQTFTDWEMVIVDDASTDRTRDVLDKFARQDVRFRLVSNEKNKGQTACLNQGLRVCRGEWVARQDADDLSHPQRLAAQMEFLRCNPETVLLGTQGVLIDACSRKIGLLDVPCGEAEIHWCAPFLNPFLHTAVVFRRNVVLETGGYDEAYRIAQDYELWTRLAVGRQTANLPGWLIRYRHTESSLSRAGRDLAFAEADRVSAREAERMLGRPWNSDEERLSAEFRRGMGAGLRGRFWEMISALEKETGRALPTKLRAAWHLRLAGTGGGGAAAEVMAAFRTAPMFTMRWLYGRFVSS